MNPSAVVLADGVSIMESRSGATLQTSELLNRMARSEFVLRGGPVDSVMTEKMENDAASFIRSLAQKHKRNAERAERAVRQSVSASDDEALAPGIVELVAPSLQALLVQLDGREVELLSGRRTPGRVTTQEKVFATWKSFYAGFNERGAIAPYLTGFSTMGSVTDGRGERILDQVMPVTHAGLSGVTMIHLQMHIVRGSARACAECHRSSATWGLGSPNFRLTRQLAGALC